jgi:ComF family protein
MIQQECLRLYSRIKLFSVKHFSVKDGVFIGRGYNYLLALTHLRPKHRCGLCQAISTQRLCTPCQQQFLFTPHYHCTCCALPLQHSALFCGECLKQRPHFDSTFSPYTYQAPLSNLLARFKYTGDLFIGKALAEVFAEKIRHHYQQQHIPLPDMITPVPLHWKKQWQRGFNQAYFFSHHIHQHLDIPILKKVKRIKAAPAQKNLDRKKRLRNLQHSFAVTSPLNGEHIAIIDDVMTTGATANALALTLKKRGAGKVSIWVLARTPKGNG